jgi:hypothetical protein
MTMIRINDPSRLELLLADLRERPDVVAEIIAPDRIRINILGSYNLASMRLAILPTDSSLGGKRNARAASTLRSTSSSSRGQTHPRIRAMPPVPFL